MSSFPDEDYNYYDLTSEMPNVTVIENETYCWNKQLQSYIWCQEQVLYSVPISIIILLSTCYGAISLVAICGNVLVIGAVVFTRSMRNVTNFYIANLASADVIISLFCIPFQFYAALLQRWDLPPFMCKFCPFTQTLCLNVSIFTLVTISLDRYKAIMSPFSGKTKKSSAKLIVLGVWIVSSLLAVPMIFFFEFSEVFDETTGGVKPFCTLGALLTPVEGGNDTDYAPGPFQKIPTFQTYNLVLSAVQYVLPLLVISAAYARMGKKLWLTKTPGAAQQKRDEIILNNKKKTIKMLFIVVSIFGICWMPWHLYHSLTILFPSFMKYINILFFISHWLAMSNSCYNPFIYAIYSEKFKREFRECAYCKCFHRILGRNSGTSAIEDRTQFYLESTNHRYSTERINFNTVNSVRSLNSFKPNGNIIQVPTGKDENRKLRQSYSYNVPTARSSDSTKNSQSHV